MVKSIYNFIASYSSIPLKVNRLITSAFIIHNKIKLQSDSPINNYIIEKDDLTEYKSLLEFLILIKSEFNQFTIEDLIELFEFVISPSDRVINGAIYTPKYIREYIIKQCIDKSSEINSVKLCDPACGCGGFLYTAAKILKSRTGKSYVEIFKNQLFGLDIQQYSVDRSRLLLSLFALSENEDVSKINFNIFKGDALSFEWKNCITKFKGFNIIVSNPPYVSSRNIDQSTFSKLRRWEVTHSGHPDLYIPFFQIGYENLAQNGILGYITVNTFLKSINGRALREYFSKHQPTFKLINFGSEQIFKDKSTYTCLCFIQNKVGSIKYLRIESKKLNSIKEKQFHKYNYEELDYYEGWNLVNNASKKAFVNNIENVGIPFSHLYTTRNGIATLKNDVFKFKAIREDKNYYFMNSDNRIYRIEKAICKRIVNSNKLKNITDLKKLEEQIIYPYTNNLNEPKIIPEKHFKIKYPNAYAYLLDKKDILATRDKGNVSDYEKWYAYGRRQSMNISSNKLFFPHICEKPSFVISRDKELLFYNGIAVISDKISELTILKTLLESDIFYNYLKQTSKDYSSGYFSMSKNYIKNFGVVMLTEDEKVKLLRNKENANQFWKAKYKAEFNKLKNKK